MNHQNLHSYELLAQSLTNLNIIPNPTTQPPIQQDMKLQINRYLKPHMHSLSYSKLLRKDLKQLIKRGELNEMNYNWYFKGLDRALLELSGARTMSHQNPKVFQEILQLKHRYPDSYFEPILIDVTRTTSPSRNQKLYESKIQTILTAYAIRNPQVAYCQGLNFIVHFITNKLKFSEEDTFWMLSQLIEVIMPLDYYTNMISVIVDTKILEYYSKIFVPRLIQHFKEIYLEANFYAIQWFVCLFAPNLHLEIVKEIWLRVVTSGNKALLIAAITILFIFQEELLTFHDFGELLEYFRKKLKSFDNVHQFRFVYNQIKIKSQPLFQARDQLRQSLQKDQEQLIQCDQIEKAQCDLNWTICQQVINVNRALKRSFSFFAYSQKEPCEVISDYWNQQQFSKQEQQSITQVDEPNILIGRQFHICQQSDDQDVAYRSTILISYKENQVQSQLVSAIQSPTRSETPESSSQDSSDDDQVREIRPRSKAVHKFIATLGEQGYDDFYRHASFLIKNQHPQQELHHELLFREVSNPIIQEKFRVARKSVGSIAFADQFIQK